MSELSVTFEVAHILAMQVSKCEYIAQTDLLHDIRCELAQRFCRMCIQDFNIDRFQDECLFSGSAAVGIGGFIGTGQAEGVSMPHTVVSRRPTPRRL